MAIRILSAKQTRDQGGGGKDEEKRLCQGETGRKEGRKSFLCDNVSLDVIWIRKERTGTVNGILRGPAAALFFFNGRRL